MLECDRRMNFSLSIKTRASLQWQDAGNETIKQPHDHQKCYQSQNYLKFLKIPQSFGICSHIRLYKQTEVR